MEKIQQNDDKNDTKCDIDFCDDNFEYYCPSNRKRVCFNCKMLYLSEFICHQIDRSPAKAKVAIANIYEVFRIVDSNFKNFNMVQIYPNLVQNVDQYRDRLEKIESRLNKCIQKDRSEKFSSLQHQACELYKEFIGSQVMNDYKNCIVQREFRFNINLKSQPSQINELSEQGVFKQDLKINFSKDIKQESNVISDSEMFENNLIVDCMESEKIRTLENIIQCDEQIWRNSLHMEEKRIEKLYKELNYEIKNNIKCQKELNQLKRQTKSLNHNNMHIVRNDDSGSNLHSSRDHKHIPESADHPDTKNEEYKQIMKKIKNKKNNKKKIRQDNTNSVQVHTENSEKTKELSDSEMEEESEKDKTNKEEEDELNEESERDEVQNHDQSIFSRFTQFIDPIKGYIEIIDIKTFSLLFLLIILLIVIFTTSLPETLAGPKFEGYEQPVIQNLNSNQNSNNPVQPPSVSAENLKPDISISTASSEKEGEGVKSQEPIKIQEQKQESLNENIQKLAQTVEETFHIVVEEVVIPTIDSASKKFEDVNNSLKKKFRK